MDWLRKLGGKPLETFFLLCGKVNHSYSVNGSSLLPWVAIRMNGTVEYGHRSCMAVLGETCSHIAAILYWLQTAARINKSTSCTSMPNSWLPPTLPRACKYLMLLWRSWRKFSIDKKKIQPLSKKWEAITKQVPTEEDLKKFFLSLSKAPNRNPALLSVLPGYSDAYSQSSQHLPTPLQGLYCPDNLHLNYSELLENTKDIYWDPILELQVKHSEELTRGQRNNKQWYK